MPNYIKKVLKSNGTVDNSSKSIASLYAYIGIWYYDIYISFLHISPRKNKMITTSIKRSEARFPAVGVLKEKKRNTVKCRIRAPMIFNSLLCILVLTICVHCFMSNEYQWVSTRGQANTASIHIVFLVFFCQDIMNCISLENWSCFPYSINCIESIDTIF